MYCITSQPCPNFFFHISGWSTGETEEPDDIEVTVFVEVTDEAEIELSEAW